MMRRGLLVLAAVCGACGDDGSGFDCRVLYCSPVDGPPGDADTPFPKPAHPSGQQGCVTGQKATWVVIAETPEWLGTVKCAASGTRPLGASCTWGPPGELTGVDDCDAGLACSQGACFDICELGAASGVTACSFGTCTIDPLLFSNGQDMPRYGVCQ